MITTELVEDFSILVEQVGKYFQDHFNSCEEYRSDKQKLNINPNIFQTMMDAGSMNWYIIRDDEDIVGYINVTIQVNPLYNEVQGIIDNLYILPEFRRKGYTKKCIQEIEQVLTKEGIKDLNIALPSKEYSEKVAESLGYCKTSTIYTKFLGDK